MTKTKSGSRPVTMMKPCKVPYPGSDEAIKKGCKCPILDNGHGDKEIGRIRGFWINANCSLHGDDNEAA